MKGNFKEKWKKFERQWKEIKEIWKEHENNWREMKQKLYILYTERYLSDTKKW